MHTWFIIPQKASPCLNDKASHIKVVNFMRSIDGRRQVTGSDAEDRDAFWVCGAFTKVWDEYA